MERQLRRERVSEGRERPRRRWPNRLLTGWFRRALILSRRHAPQQVDRTHDDDDDREALGDLAADEPDNADDDQNHPEPDGQPWMVEEASEPREEDHAGPILFAESPGPAVLLPPACGTNGSRGSAGCFARVPTADPESGALSDLPQSGSPERAPRPAESNSQSSARLLAFAPSCAGEVVPHGGRARGVVVGDRARLTRRDRV